VKRKNLLSFMQRLQPEPDLIILNHDKTLRHNVNRFQVMSRLSQYWPIESFSRSMDQQISFQRANQKFLKVILILTTIIKMVKTMMMVVLVALHFYQIPFMALQGKEKK
jgi:hypothetical protein